MPSSAQTSSKRYLAPVPLKELIGNLPPLRKEPGFASIRKELLASKKSIIVFDDDPTGTQAVSGLPVLTTWSKEIFIEEFKNETPVVFILTNSRSLTANQTVLLHKEIGRNILAASKETGREFIPISRTDSTLRCHFPLETETLARSLELDGAIALGAPFFQDGGRITVDDTHFVVEGDSAIPVHLTPFAKDNAFPYSHSYLPDFVEEKSGGRMKADDVQSLPIELIRKGGPHAVREFLLSLPPSTICMVNATDISDLTVVCSALPEVESQRPVIYRTAASFVQARAGLPPSPLLTSEQLADPENSPNGGLIVVGSHVPKTTAQLNHLLNNCPELKHINLDIPALLEEPATLLPKLTDEVNQTLAFGRHIVLSTSRKRVDADSMKKNLLLSQVISDTIVSIFKSLNLRPRFFIAKGGITSSSIATDAFNVKRAMVLGQILPGVPVWTLGPETRHPGLPYVIFPGNVGSDSALTEAYQKLTSCPVH